MKKLLFVVFVFCTFKASKRMTHFNLEKNVAIQGYDPVAYFKQGKALKGRKK
jgi:urocanate hydratase